MRLTDDPLGHAAGSRSPDGRTMQTLSPPLRLSHTPPPQPEWVGNQSGWTQSITDDGPIDVSVCVANWNCKDHLWECLTSVEDIPQGVRVEAIVVDNASTDGAAEMVAEEFPEVVLVRNASNVGFAQASNQAAALARGRYLFFLNNDTVLPAFTLRHLVDYADANPEVGMIGPRLRDGYGNHQISYRRRPTIAAMLHRTALLRWTGLFKFAYHDYRRKNFAPMSKRRVDVLMGAAILMPRGVFEDAGRWDEDFRFGVEDVELSTRVAATHELAYLPDVEVIHHGRLSSRENIAFAAPNLLIGYVHYFRKTHAPRAGIFFYKLVVTVDTPIQLLVKSIQYLFRRIRGKKAKAEKSRLSLKGLWHFFRYELGRFWKA
jgi:GT2 family glycosyltransferase